MPKTKRTEFTQKGFDEAQWRKYFHSFQQEYLRKRLRAIKLFAENNDVPTIAQTLALSKNSVYAFLKTYLTEGFAGLCRQATRPKATRLSPAQELLFKHTILTKAPFECGFTGNIWTGALMRQLITREFGVDYKSGIYDLLARLKLSHQRAHSDYQNADPSEQVAFLDHFKQVLHNSDPDTAVLTCDEFAISSKPSNYYGWAEKNTRPRVKTEEKKESARTAS